MRSASTVDDALWQLFLCSSSLFLNALTEFEFAISSGSMFHSFATLLLKKKYLNKNADITLLNIVIQITRVVCLR
ncbi:hypothetical protein BpHYR1_009405 [Brachionus plicatilis]|uniref:Uncharacterized protein n=1 Tax=Brachionus plicatilis TaxID=10195 RepID=A0A3M7RMK3_BRAPC|nr:hypothetical protein BpHYR1_009405 [Brachionus plicatilis]